MAGRFLLGTSLFHLGQLAASREQMEQAAQTDGARSDPALALFAGPDVGVFRRAYLSHLLWHLGQAEQAAANSEEAIALAREISHPFSLAIALDYAAMFNVFRQEGQLALARAREASAVCRKHGFVYYLAWAEILEGWAIAVRRGPRRRVTASPPWARCIEGDGSGSFAFLFTTGCWLKCAAWLVKLAKHWPTSLADLRFRARTVKCGRRPNCTGSMVMSSCAAEMLRNLR